MIAVGGTKDVLYVHQSAVHGLRPIDPAVALTMWDSCCKHVSGCPMTCPPPNPSNGKMLEHEPHPYSTFALGPHSPSHWYTVASMQTAPEELLDSMDTYMRSACLRRAANIALPVEGEVCPFEYLLGPDSVQGERAFTARVHALVSSRTARA